MHFDLFCDQFCVKKKINDFKNFVNAEVASNMIESEIENPNLNKFKGNGDWKV